MNNASLLDIPIIKKPTDIFKIDLNKGIKQFKNIDRIKEEIEKMLDEFPKSQIYAPLGIGNHFDHVEVFLSALMYMVDHALYDKFLFYVDFYGMFSTKMRRKHFLGKKIISRGTKKPEKSSFKWFMITTVMNALISGNAIEKLLPSKYLDLEWELKTNSIKGYEKLKISSLKCYESQVKLFGIKTIDKFFDRHHKNWDSSELFLKVKTS